MYDNKAAQAKLDSMNADELYRHVALQGGLMNLTGVNCGLITAATSTTMAARSFRPVFGVLYQLHDWRWNSSHIATS